MASSVELKVSDLIRNDLRQVLVKELGSEKIDWKVEAGSAKGDNFIGIVYRVVGKLTENDAVTSISVILKIAPTSKARREAIAMREVFLREIKIYEEVLPMFWRFQISKGISPEENGFNEYPKCYKTIDAEINETLILEDLKVLKFELFDRFQIVSIEHMRLIMMALGQYHALSIALKDQQPQELERFTILEENFLKRIDEKVLIYLEAMLDGAYKSLDHEGDERLLGKMKEFFKRGYDRIMREYCSGKLAEPYTVMCHGDCWNNNVLFKNDENGRPIDLRLLDWQFSRYASPVTDLVYCIFICTTKSFRDLYYDDMIRTYHASSSEMIARMGSDPAKLFSFDALQDQLRRFGGFALAMAPLVLPISTLETENCPDLDEWAEWLERGESADSSPFQPVISTFNERMRDVIVDLDRLEYI